VGVGEGEAARGWPEKAGGEQAIGLGGPWSLGGQQISTIGAEVSVSLETSFLGQREAEGSQ
jgi:hypothetical protein